MKRQLLLLAAAVITLVACQQKLQTETDNFVRVENGHFVRAGKP